MRSHSAIKANYADDFRACLIDLDVSRVRKLWAHVSPHLTQPADDYETLFTLHMARTEAQSVPLSLRQYSHRWLAERGFGSHLEPHLQPTGGNRRA